ncbi:MAG: NAD-dependent epimerase/dehydratase family protein [bacterium]
MTAESDRRSALVTGGTGFTGSALVRRLLERGWRVRALDNQPGRFHDELKSLGAEILIGSVTDKDTCRAAVAGCDLVFHLAAAFRVINASKSVYWDVNVNGVANLAEASLAAGVDRFIYCSTEGVHGHVHDPPADEDAPINPQDYYEYTKWEGEKALAPFREKGLRTVVLRPTAIYGPGDPERFFMIYKRVLTGTFPMFGDGKTWYHPVYIDNLVQAFELAAEKDAAVGREYLIGDRDAVSIEELVRATARSLGVSVNIPHFPFWTIYAPSVVCEAVCKPLGIAPPLFPRRADWYRKTRQFDVSRAIRELGYDPKVELAEGLRRTAEWYWQEGLLPRPGKA